MKRNIVILTILSLFLFAGFSGCNVNNKPFTEADLTKIIETDWQEYTSNKPDFNGGIAMQVTSPKGDYFVSTGMGDEVTNKYHFRIASVSKTFTAAAIMLLHQRGLLDINDRITDNIPGTNYSYIPNTADYDLPYKNDITIRMLLMHRAGIFDLSNNVIPENDFSRNEPYVNQNYLTYQMEIDPTHNFTFDELLGVNSKNQLSFFEPGSSYHYSDTGYSLLGKIIEQVSLESYHDFITKELIEPNNLQDTIVVYQSNDQTLPEPFAPGNLWINGEIGDVTLQNMSPHVGEGSVISTPWDLASWAKKLFTGEAGLTQETVAMMKSGMTRNDGTDSTYGLGVVCDVVSGCGHSGAHEGYLTNMIYNPKTEVAYVVFTNIWDCSTCDESLDSIMGELKVMTDTASDILEKIGY